eukprot:2662318-Pyramimonas_sp.AAC.1
MHLLLMLENKPTSVEDFDNIVCAEIPDPEEEPELYSKVHHMIHGPCGDLNRNAACMKEDKCSKHYPKAFAEETATGNDGYPVYRRRNNGRTVERGGRVLDNRWVVPYNRALLQRYDAHINAEVSSGVAVVKYLFKYLTKGHDRGMLQVGGGGGDGDAPAGRAAIGGRDEIQEFVDGRYVSGAEACWRLFHFVLDQTRPNVVRLQIHLDGEQTVVFEEGADLREVQQAAAQRRTTLTAWFQFNQEHPELAADVLYPDMPAGFVFNQRSKKWCQRRQHQRFPAIGRMYYVTPTAGERFYLRLLLNNVPGCKSYEDVRTVDNVVCATFREAAARRGLLRGDEEWDWALQEATEWQMCPQLRSLFVNILMFCAPDNPLQLWTSHAAA